MLGFLRLGLLLLTLLGAAGCINTHMVTVRNLDSAPEPAETSGWKDEVGAILARYAASPALSSGDERLRPIFGGVVTLAYFGPDLAQKLRDQRGVGGSVQSGTSLAEACATSAQLAALPAGVGRERAAVSVWLPLSIDGSPVGPGSSCSERGEPIGNGAMFCMHGRLLLQRAAAPLVLVVHGMFDSSDQSYVRRMGDALYELGHSVLLLDMRDHGDTFRAAPAVPTTLGHLESWDLLAAARGVRSSCGQATGIGAMGVSGGGLDVLLAYARDASNGSPVLDRGALAFSPLVDVDGTMAAVDQDRKCSVLEAAELSFAEVALLGGAGAVAFGGGAATAQAVAGDRLDEATLIAAGVGAVVGLGAGLLADAMMDGDSVTSDRCVAQASIGHLFQDLVRARWDTLLKLGAASGMNADALATPNWKITLGDYMKKRSRPYYLARGIELPPSYEPSSLAQALQARPRATGDAPKLLLLAAEDDPVTPEVAHAHLADATEGLPDVMVASVPVGGHGAMWVVQERMVRELVERVLGAAR